MDNQKTKLSQGSGSNIVLATGCVAILWLFIFLYSLQATLPPTALDLPASDQPILKAVLPQGWNFFTRDPHEDSLFVFRYEKTGWENALLPLNGSAVNIFGLRRTTRAQGVELGVVLTMISDSAWKTCESAPTSCLDESEEVHALIMQENFPNPTLCGKIGIVQQRPLPWAWRGSIDDLNMPSEVVKLDVSCWRA